MDAAKAIRDLMQIYFDANYEADAQKIASVFHTEAHVFGRDDDGALIKFDKESFVKLIDSLSPETGPRIDEILSIDFIGENAAVCRVRLQVGNTIYTDIISLMNLKNKWGIISKVYSGAVV